MNGLEFLIVSTRSSNDSSKKSNPSKSEGGHKELDELFVNIINNRHIFYFLHNYGSSYHKFVYVEVQ